MTTIIISDIHLGARNNRTDLLAELLKQDFDRLILNGDTVDSLDFRKFRSSDWRVFDQLRNIALERELVLIRGNHDAKGSRAEGFGPSNVLADLLGTDLLEQFEIWVGGDRYVILHGDRFDGTMNLTWVGDAADWFYRQTQRGSKTVAHVLKAGVKQFGGVVTSVQQGAIRYAREQGYTGIITGHTHFWHDEWVDGIHFLNTGCWVDWPCSYVMVRGGDIRVLHWTEPVRSSAMTSSHPVMQAS